MSLHHQIMQDSPAGYWPLDETSGTTVFDRSGNGRNGTYTGTVTLGAVGFAGLKAMEVAGAGYVTIPDDAAWSPTNLTVEGWVYRTAAGPANQMFMAKGLTDEWDLFLTLGGTSSFYLGNTAAGSFVQVDPAQPGVGVWVHLVGTWDGTTLREYQNGVLVASSVTTTGTRQGDSTAPVNIGRRNDGNFPATARFAHAAIFPSALSAARIKAHYEAGIRSGVVV